MVGTETIDSSVQLTLYVDTDLRPEKNICSYNTNIENDFQQTINKAANLQLRLKISADIGKTVTMLTKTKLQAAWLSTSCNNKISRKVQCQIMVQKIIFKK